MLHKTWPLLKTKPEKGSENKAKNVICHDVKPLLCPQLEQCMQFWFLHLGKDTVKFKNLPKKANKMTKEEGNWKRCEAWVWGGEAWAMGLRFTNPWGGGEVSSGLHFFFFFSSASVWFRIGKLSIFSYFSNYIFINCKYIYIFFLRASLITWRQLFWAVELNAILVLM